MMKARKMALFVLGLPKTVLFNLKYLPLREAVRLPVFVSHRVWLMKLSGKVKVNDVRPGSVKIGFGEVGIFDRARSRTIWHVTGSVEFKGKADIGHGSKLCVGGNLVLGKDFCISAESSIVAQKSITMGNNVLVSWESLIMDTDLHDIYDSTGTQTNPPLPVTIGNRVWIGCRSLIMKGVNVADGVVVAATSTLNRSIDIPNSLATGNPARVVKENITWKT